MFTNESGLMPLCTIARTDALFSAMLWGVITNTLVFVCACASSGNISTKSINLENFGILQKYNLKPKTVVLFAKFIFKKY